MRCKKIPSDEGFFNEELGIRNEEFRNADALIVIELKVETVKLKTITQ